MMIGCYPVSTAIRIRGGQVLQSNISRIGEPDHASFSARLELGEITRFQRLPCYPTQAKLLDLARFKGLFTPIGP